MPRPGRRNRPQRFYGVTPVQTDQTTTAVEEPVSVEIAALKIDRIIDTIARSYCYDISLFSETPVEELFPEVRSFTADLLRGNVDFVNLPLAKDRHDPLDKAIAKKAKQHALQLGDLIRQHNPDIALPDLQNLRNVSEELDDSDSQETGEAEIESDLSDEEKALEAQMIFDHFITELFNRGLLPLAALTADPEVLDALVLGGENKPGDILSVLHEVQEHDSELRAISLTDLFEAYETERIARLAPKQNALEKEPSTPPPLPPPGNKPKDVVTIPSEDSIRLKLIVNASVAKMLGLEVFALTKAIYSLGLDRPSPFETASPFLQPTKNGMPSSIVPSNVWLEVARCIPPLRILKQLDPLGKDKMLEQVIVLGYAGKNIDLYSELVLIVDSCIHAANEPLDGKSINDLFEVEQVLSERIKVLEQAYNDSLSALVDPRRMQTKKTHKNDDTWSVLSKNPILVRPLDESTSRFRFEPGSHAEHKRFASLLIQTPLQITDILLNGQFKPSSIDMTLQHFAHHVDDMNRRNSGFPFLDVAWNYRSAFGFTQLPKGVLEVYPDIMQSDIDRFKKGTKDVLDFYQDTTGVDISRLTGSPAQAPGLELARTFVKSYR